MCMCDLGLYEKKFNLCIILISLFVNVGIGLFYLYLVYLLDIFIVSIFIS